jgi:hypothetical protein
LMTAEARGWVNGHGAIKLRFRCATPAHSCGGGGMSGLRQSILDVVTGCHPAQATMALLRTTTGCKNAVINEHVQALRWKGLIMFDALALTPSAAERLFPIVPGQNILSDQAEAGARVSPAPAPANSIPEADTPVLRSVSRVAVPVVAALPVPRMECAQAAPLAPKKPMRFGWIEQRAAAIAEAISYLKSQCILVQVMDRKHPIRAYRISGLGSGYLHDDVIALAERVRTKAARQARAAARLDA